MDVCGARVHSKRCTVDSEDSRAPVALAELRGSPYAIYHAKMYKTLFIECLAILHAMSRVCACALCCQSIFVSDCMSLPMLILLLEARLRELLHIMSCGSQACALRMRLDRRAVECSTSCHVASQTWQRMKAYLGTTLTNCAMCCQSIVATFFLNQPVQACTFAKRKPSKPAT